MLLSGLLSLLNLICLHDLVFFCLHNLALFKTQCMLSHSLGMGLSIAHLLYSSLGEPLCASLLLRAPLSLSSSSLETQLSSASLTTSGHLSLQRFLLYGIVCDCLQPLAQALKYRYNVVDFTRYHFSSCFWIEGRLYFLDAFTFKWSHVTVAKTL